MSAHFRCQYLDTEARRDEKLKSWEENIRNEYNKVRSRQYELGH